jgi:magnesium transporter
VTAGDPAGRPETGGRPHRAGRRGETAAHYLIASIPRALPQETAGQVRQRLATRVYESVDPVWVTDEAGTPVGVVPLAGLLSQPEERPIGEVLQPRPPAVRADVDQERVASVALHHGTDAVPVVDHSGHLLGVVPSSALLQILRREHVEDLHRLAGIGRETVQSREAIESPPMRRARHRLPWLLLGLAGSVLATAVVASFEGDLRERVALAFFIPGLVYLADAIGTQTEAIAVRGLSLSHARLAHLIGGELRTGLLIGATLGLIVFPGVWLVFGDARLAGAVSLSLFCSGGLATTVGLLLPWVLQQLGTDPAYGSGPLATVIQDVLTLLVYFAVASLTVS